jgi:hypothetical protein
MTTQLVLMNGDPRPSGAGLLDERTKQVGRLGLVRARAALAEANRRANERDAERMAHRENELARRAAAAQHRADNPASGAGTGAAA